MNRPAGIGVQRHMHASEGLIHWVMIVCTVGLWYPIYRHRKNSLARTTRYYAG